ncbi:MAG: NAD(P)-binding domain-containing protein [Candidatus Jacksonbacteria bacterium]|nr:NAD(P)-binding domain-containing protein [Candidatus Jacksonbacteria bacterium]
MNFVSKYFNWLQKDNPRNIVESYPEIDEQKETSVQGVYIVGDLTGIPLLRLAADGGTKIVKQLFSDQKATSEKEKSTDVYDLIIVGAGPAGISAAIECKKKNINYIILESNRILNTIENFPKEKPITLKPDRVQLELPLEMNDGFKETLIEELTIQIEREGLNFEVGTFVQRLSRKDNIIHIETNKNVYMAEKAVLAIGKAGNSRQLKVPGELLPKVFNKLYDPGEFVDKDILVVGGGDSSMECSIALAKSGNKIIHSYRKEEFSRPKEENMDRFNDLVEQGKITPFFESTVTEIRENEVVLRIKEDSKTIHNDAVFTLIGRELPTKFFKRSGIRMEGENGLSWWWFMVASISFFSMLYFGKVGIAFDLFAGADTIGAKIIAYLSAPFQTTLNWSLSGYKWYPSLNFILGWTGSIIFIISGTCSLGLLARHGNVYFRTPWRAFKYTYFIGVSSFFTILYFSKLLNNTSGRAEWIESPTYWYSLFYCVTMLIFGIRRSYVRKTRYVFWQMTALVSIQIFFLFLLPFHLFKPLILENLGAQHWIVSELFPSGKWSSFAFILFWPLNMWEFGSSTFWTWFPFVQTGLILFFLIRHYGKGVYCGWICSCGGMAETLGDEYRRKTPHGPGAKRLENIGQIVLFAAIIFTPIIYLNKSGMWSSFPLLSYTMTGVYKFLIDVIFAGILGLGVYFFLGGRIWCRYGCPLAALMHIYTRFSRYRILSEKKYCISCEICTRVCHMGIDVMNFANKGIPMNDVQCVRCSACVTECPMDVLSFEKLKKTDIHNVNRDQIPYYGKDSWRAGIK